jgi:hypothetical protein
MYYIRLMIRFFHEVFTYSVDDYVNMNNDRKSRINKGE